MTILFLHGWQSTPGGVKPTYLAQHGHELLNPALPDDNFDAAVHIGQAEFDRAKPDVVVGSSRGGAVAMNIEPGETPLVLLCPAWKRWRYVQYDNEREYAEAEKEARKANRGLWADKEPIPPWE